MSELEPDEQTQQADTPATPEPAATQAGDPQPAGSNPNAGAELAPVAGEATADSVVPVPTESVDARPAAESTETAPVPETAPITMDEVSAEQLLVTAEAAPELETDDARLLAMLEAVIYVTDEPLTSTQFAAALGQPQDRIERLLEQLVASYESPERGISIRQVAGGYKMGTKPEHHEEVRTFVKNLKPPLKLSLAALETLAVIAYKQPITAPEIMDIRGVQGAGVLKTLVDRKLITTAGRKAVVGKPILYRTTKDFLVQFGLKDLNELPTLKEFEELRRMAFEGDTPEPAEVSPARSELPAVQDQAPPPLSKDLLAETPGAAPAGPGVSEPANPEPASEHQEGQRPD